MRSILAAYEEALMKKKPFKSTHKEIHQSFPQPGVLQPAYMGSQSSTPVVQESNAGAEMNPSAFPLLGMEGGA